MTELDLKNETPNAAKPVLSEVPFLDEPTNMDWNDALKQLPDGCVDLVVTDPPYGMNYQSNTRKEKHKKIVGDDNLDWLEGWVVELKRLCKHEAHLYIFCSWHKVDEFKQTIQRYFNIKNILIWDKKGFGMGDLDGDYAPSYEMVIFCSNGSKKLNGGRDRNILRTVRTNNENHPTENPVNLIRYFIEKSSEKGDIVLDTFAGSFSTARACKEIRRHFLCFEIDADYCAKGRQLLNGTEVSLFYQGITDNNI